MIPRRTTAALACAALMVLLAATGCLGTETDTDAAARDPAGDQQAGTAVALDRLELPGCEEHLGIFTIPASQAEPYLPDGFTPVGANGDPLPEGTAEVLLLSLTCSGPGPNGTVDQLWIEIIVEPPAAYEHEGALLHYVHVAGVTTSPTLRASFQAWGLPQMASGDLQLDRVEEPPFVHPWTTQATEGDRGARLVTTALGPPQTVEGGTIRIFGVQDRAVTGILDASFDAFDTAAGEARVADAGLVPFDVAGPGAGMMSLGFDTLMEPAELPAAP